MRREPICRNFNSTDASTHLSDWEIGEISTPQITSRCIWLASCFLFNFCLHIVFFHGCSCCLLNYLERIGKVFQSQSSCTSIRCSETVCEKRNSPQSECLVYGISSGQGSSVIKECNSGRSSLGLTTKSKTNFARLLNMTALLLKLSFSPDLVKQKKRFPKSLGSNRYWLWCKQLLPIR